MGCVKQTYIHYRHHTQLITDQWVNVKRISNLKSHKLNIWVSFHSLTHSLQPHQIFDHTKLMYVMYNKPHSLTNTLSPTTPKCGMGFLSLTTNSLQPHQSFGHTKWCKTNQTYSFQPHQIVTTPNRCTCTTNKSTLWPHQYHINVSVWYTSSLTHSTTLYHTEYNHSYNIYDHTKSHRESSPSMTDIFLDFTHWVIRTSTGFK